MKVALALVIATAAVAHAQPARLAPGDVIAPAEHPPQVVLLTFGVGDRIFEKFGHAAICLRDEQSARDAVCFNYGVTDFAAGTSMIWDFLRTQQKFWVDAESYTSTMHFYQREDRDIYEQVLPLSADQARAIEKKLLYDVEPEHKYYVYDHFFNNCTTRLRDLIDGVTGGKLRGGTDAKYALTFREMGVGGLSEFPWMAALADFIVGRQLDETPTMWEAMFEPDVLRSEVAAKLGVVPDRLYTRHGAAFPTHGPSDRGWAFLVALVFALPLLVARITHRFERAALAWATFYLALCGFVIWGLAVLSPIGAVRWNEAVFVMMPLDLALPFLTEARRRRYARARVVGLLVVSVLVAIGLFHQPLWVPIMSAFMPLAIAARLVPWGD
jgi:hypothetical protein